VLSGRKFSCDPRSLLFPATMPAYTDMAVPKPRFSRAGGKPILD
jgi:hypothetical protein